MPTYGSPRSGGYVPSAVQKFLEENSEYLDGVIGVGNSTFGPDFCKGARIVSGAYKTPLIMEIDVVPSAEQAERLTQLASFYKEKDEEVS